MTAFLPTSEQSAIVDDFLTGSNLVVEAGAGTGKTSTLRLIADAALRQPGSRRGLYLAFNRAIKLEAETKFAGTSVEARTAHSLAYARFGRQYDQRIRQGNRMPARERAEILDIRNKLGFGDHGEHTVQKHVAARIAAETMTKFCRSSDSEIGTQHVPVLPSLELDEKVAGEFREAMVPLAQRYWENATSQSGTLPVTHDVYLKLWSLSDPKLDYDFILYDEAQDSDGATAHVIDIQSNQIVAVGDRAQAIYGWRGAIDSMDRFGGNLHQLTQSFRFGPAIADEANQWLDLLNASLRVRGSEKPSSVHYTHGRLPEAVLTRTNAGAISEVMDMLARGVTVGIAGEGRKKQLHDLAKAAKTLIEEGWTRHPELDNFQSWDDVKAYVEEDEDAELAPLVNLIERYGHDKLIRAIDSTGDPRESRVVVSTVHVAKGLEWLHVRIADDFKVPDSDDNGHLEQMRPDDMMLNYVAVTRAQRHLDPGGLGFVRDYKRALARPQIGMEWRRRFREERADWIHDQEVRAA